MNYEYADAYLEITFPSGNIARLKKSTIKTFWQHKDGEGNVLVNIKSDSDSFTYHGTLEELEKNSKTVFI